MFVCVCWVCVCWVCVCVCWVCMCVLGVCGVESIITCLYVCVLGIFVCVCVVMFVRVCLGYDCMCACWVCLYVCVFGYKDPSFSHTHTNIHRVYFYHPCVCVCVCVCVCMYVCVCVPRASFTLSTHTTRFIYALHLRCPHTQPHSLFLSSFLTPKQVCGLQLMTRLFRMVVCGLERVLITNPSARNSYEPMLLVSVWLFVG